MIVRRMKRPFEMNFIEELRNLERRTGGLVNHGIKKENANLIDAFHEVTPIEVLDEVTHGHRNAFVIFID